MVKFSIVIPVFNSEPYISELLNRLVPQITEEAEVIVVDDGSLEPFKTSHDIKVIRQENKGCATARNRGLENSIGQYVAFVDSDDMVSDHYVAKVIETIDKYGTDVIEISWKSLNDDNHNHKLEKDSDRLLNNSCWCRIFKRDFIGDNRFNELKDSTEDEDFTRHIGIRDANPTYTRSVITDYLYFYRDVENSKIKRFKQGLMKTKRVTYHIKHVTKDRTDILEQIIEDDKRNEVLLITDKCDIPELSRYCQIYKSLRCWTHYLKGEPYQGMQIIRPRRRGNA